MQYDAGQIGGLSAYERGGQAYFIKAASGNLAQVGSAQPVGTIAYGLPPTNSNDQLPEMIIIQIDATGSLAGNVNLLGSLDGVNFYPLPGGTIAFVAATGSISSNFGVGARYITVSITGTSGTGTVTVSFAS